MPIMPRPKKAKKIAYNIIGIPDNLAFRRSKRQKILNRKLLWEESSRIR